MSAAHYMVSIKTDMPTKNPRPEELNDNVAKKPKLPVVNTLSQHTEWQRLQILENAATNVTNKKETFDELVLKLAHDYTTSIQYSVIFQPR